MRLIDADACPALFDAEFQETKRLILAGEKHLDNLAEGFMEAHNVIRSMPTIAPPPNDPLTLEELREMDGEPVYLDFEDGGEWALVRVLQGKVFVVHKNAIPSPVNILFECGGTAYRRKPEEGTA